MSRTRMKPRTVGQVVSELVCRTAELGGGDDAALAAFRRLIRPVATGPSPLGPAELQELCSSQPVLAEGRLWELFQRQLDPIHRRRQGKFFTPQALVQFLVQSVGRILSKFDQDRPLHVIDPACGYGAFLIEAARALPGCRLTGMELCRATTSVAHLLCGREHNRPRATLIHANPLLAGESLREIILGPPRRPMVPVIIGNPPWSNFGRQNRGSWIDGLLADYRTGLHEKKTNLADDAIKFIRWSQYWVEQAGMGVVALVTPNTWLAGLTHRRMRQSLLESFDELFAVDLHGQTRSDCDENVFDVRSGVAVAILVRHKRARKRMTDCYASCKIASLRGSRSEKLARLTALAAGGLGWRKFRPMAPDWKISSTIEPRRTFIAKRTYASFWPLDRIFRCYSSGVQTKNDAVFVGFTRQALARQVRSALAASGQASEFDENHIRPYLLAPFDRRWIYYDPGRIGRARWKVMRHMLEPNVGLVFMRQSTNAGEYDHFLAVDCLVSDRVFYSRHGAPFLAPLWLRDGGQRPEVRGQFDANFADEFVASVAERIHAAPKPEELFCYLYGVAHWPTYRRLYGELLSCGFPRIPLPVDGDAYLALLELGRQLFDLHLERAPPTKNLLPAAEIRSPFRLGGYDVVRRWSRPREAFDLAPGEDLQRLAWIGRDTERLMAEIDQRVGTSLAAFAGSPQPPPPGVSIVSTSPG